MSGSLESRSHLSVGLQLGHDDDDDDDGDPVRVEQVDRGSGCRAERQVNSLRRTRRSGSRRKGSLLSDLSQTQTDNKSGCTQSDQP